MSKRDKNGYNRLKADFERTGNKELMDLLKQRSDLDEKIRQAEENQLEGETIEKGYAKLKKDYKERKEAKKALAAQRKAERAQKKAMRNELKRQVAEKETAKDKAKKVLIVLTTGVVLAGSAIGIGKLLKNRNPIDNNQPVPGASTPGDGDKEKEIDEIINEVVEGTKGSGKTTRGTYTQEQREKDADLKSEVSYGGQKLDDSKQADMTGKTVVEAGKDQKDPTLSEMKQEESSKVKQEAEAAKKAKEEAVKDGKVVEELGSGVIEVKEKDDEEIDKKVEQAQKGGYEYEKDENERVNTNEAKDIANDKTPNVVENKVNANTSTQTKDTNTTNQTKAKDNTFQQVDDIDAILESMQTQKTQKTIDDDGAR